MCTNKKYKPRRERKQMSDRIKYEKSSSALPDRYEEETGGWEVQPTYVQWLESKVRAYEEDNLDRQLKSVIAKNESYFKRTEMLIHGDLRDALDAGWGEWIR